VCSGDSSLGTGNISSTILLFIVLSAESVMFKSAVSSNAIGSNSDRFTCLFDDPDSGPSSFFVFFPITEG